MKTRVPSIVAIAATAALFGCTLLPVTQGPPPEGYGDQTLPASEDRFPNWPLPPDQLEELLEAHASDETFRESEIDAGAGTTGAIKVEVRFVKTGDLVPFKWKPMEGGWKPIYGRLDGVNNSPRKEIAAWMIQRLFLDPEDYVVPTSVVRCIPMTHSREGASPTLADTKCVLGVASVWMKDVTLPDPLLDDERFNRDYAYARFLANLNLLTYIIKHHDGRPGNFLVSKDDSRRQVFAIDNGVAFGGIFYNWFVDNWNSIRVPALRKESIDRLRKLSEQDLHDLLGIMVQLELDDEGIYRDVPPSENLDDDDGIRIEGKVLQMGLTEDEIQDIWDRIEDLIEDVDEGDIAVF